MKTTIELPDDFFHRVELIAVERKTTLKELVLQGLRLITQTPPPDSEGDRRQEAVKRLLAGLKANNSQPMAPLKREEIYDR